ncbi:MAG: hypothetical protein ABIH92_03220 [Nanoarchaeota archaeon]
MVDDVLETTRDLVRSMIEDGESGRAKLLLDVLSQAGVHDYWDAGDCGGFYRQLVGLKEIGEDLARGNI